MDPPDNLNKQSFKIGEFEGPLDLLLFLIRKSELNIYDIPIAEITAQYIEYLNLTHLLTPFFSKDIGMEVTPLIFYGGFFQHS